MNVTVINLRRLSPNLPLIKAKDKLSIKSTLLNQAMPRKLCLPDSGTETAV